jgi:hypothetical protein
MQSLIDKPKELLEFIDLCLKPKEIEKKENGEVFTPPKNINEMLDNLPLEVWTNPNLKWFDPASGMGNFSVVVFLKLMDTLICIKNIKERKKHILENMLYVSELNKKNIYIYKQIFDINNKYNLNIYQGDTLLLNITDKWNIVKFDIIMGNPPYNKGGIKSFTGKQLGEKNETIWPNFIEYCLKILKIDGYLLFINPLSWLKKSHSLHNILLNKYIIWLRLWDDSYSKNIINADIPISLYVLHNIENNLKLKTNIISNIKRANLNIISNEYLNYKYSIPFAYHSIFNKIIEFIENNNLYLNYNTKVVKCIGNQIKLPTKYKNEDMFGVDTYTIKDGIMVKKILIKHPDMDKKKLIIANKSSFVGIFIDDGKLGLCGTDKFYILGDKLELLNKIFNFKICTIISSFTRYRQHFLDKDVFTYIPDIRKLNINDINEQDFYKLLKLTNDEINLIMNI